MSTAAVFQETASGVTIKQTHIFLLTIMSMTWLYFLTQFMIQFCIFRIINTINSFDMRLFPFFKKHKINLCFYKKEDQNGGLL